MRATKVRNRKTGQKQTMIRLMDYTLRKWIIYDLTHSLKTNSQFPHEVKQADDKHGYCQIKRKCTTSHDMILSTSKVVAATVLNCVPISTKRQQNFSVNWIEYGIQQDSNWFCISYKFQQIETHKSYRVHIFRCRY